MRCTSPPLNFLGLVLASLLSLFYLALAQNWLPLETRPDLGFAVLPFIIAVIYFVMILSHHKSLHGWENLSQGDEYLYSVALVIFSLSAHILNLTEIRVFQPYIGWMQGLVIAMHLALLLFPYRHRLPTWAQYGLYFINGAGLVLALYLCLFLGPLILIAVPAALLLGFSMHATVPVWFALEFILNYRRMRPLPYAKTAFWAGLVIPLLVLAFYLQQWHGLQRTIETRSETYAQMENPLLPRWAYLSQYLPADQLIEQVVMAGYRTQRSFWNNDGFLGFSSRDEFSRQDPLGTTALALYGRLDLDRSETIDLLNSRYDARHMTHRRLWQGGQLLTSSVETTVDLYPGYRLAYEEMVLRIYNEAKPYQRRRQQQEAVYSFYLPAGAVATSLSLWVEGEERPSRLTTRQKADSAYERIVGRERRDPALLHWQEGNRVTITVFPCTPEAERQFKIGFTTPLRYEAGRLFLENVAFDGPATDDAEQKVTVQVHGVGEVEKLTLPMFWAESEATRWEHRGRYQPGWQVSFAAPPLAQGQFVWKGQSYRVQPVPETLERWQPAEVYLDLNASWSPWEFEQVWDMVQEKPVFVFGEEGEKIRLRDENRQEVFHQLRQRRYSFFPCFQLPQPAQSLVISASTGNTPLLQDLEGSRYSREMTAWLLAQEAPLRWVNLTETVAPYLRTLADVRAVQLLPAEGEPLAHYLATSQFPRLPEDATHSWIPAADLQIVTQPANSQVSDAPDHLFRLFAFQQLLRDIGRQYYQKEALEETWVRRAEEAYIVSPVSSLVVLETQQDYERFGIDKNTDTLGNAVAQGDGAVPEPHEWVLIILAGLSLIYLAYRRYRQPQAFSL